MKGSIRLSNYQYSLLDEIITEQGGRVSLEFISSRRQDTFGSFIRRGFLEYVPGKQRAVQVTDEGYSAYTSFHEADTKRRVESSILSVYFYRKTGLKPPKMGVSGKAQAVLAALHGREVAER